VVQELNLSYKTFMKRSFYFLPFLIAFGIACNNNEASTERQPITDTVAIKATKKESPTPDLPAPFATKSVQNYCKVVGWQNKTPDAPHGFKVTKFADNLKNPRWIYIAPNGDIFVSEANTEPTEDEKKEAQATGKAESQQLNASANRITLFRDSNHDGKFDLQSVFLEKLRQPFGMLIVDSSFYVANTDGLWKYPYIDGQTKITSKGKKILSLPAGGYNNHWTRNIIANGNGSKIFISVGSGSNVGEHGMKDEVKRANILEINPDGTEEKIYAGGLRNPVGMGWAPGTAVLYTVVNERDELGDELVPDYLTSVKEGAFYGWPYAYFGQHEDPRRKGENDSLVKKTIVPDVSLGAHTASLGLAFYDKTAFPEKYHTGAFISQHGSWNRSRLSGYKVVFVPFSGGKPAGKPQDFLTGFISDESKSEVHGRPVGIAVTPDGALLVADDVSNTIWKIVYSL
jgi:glucose/arabinose dehydrogenase